MHLGLWDPVHHALQAQEKSSEKRCADLRTAFEAQIALLRNSVTSASQNASQHERRRQDAHMAALQTALAASITHAVWNSMPATATKTSSQGDILRTVKLLIRELETVVKSNNFGDWASGNDQPLQESKAAQHWFGLSETVRNCVGDLQKYLHAAWAQESGPGRGDRNQEASAANTTVRFMILSYLATSRRFCNSITWRVCKRMERLAVNKCSSGDQCQR